jgi:hypothetical protein
VGKKLYGGRKKNLIDYLEAVYKYGWTEHDCYLCRNEEQDEFIDGKPMCRAKGYCKFFANKQKKIYGDLGVKAQVGIVEFLEVARIIRSLCPTDQNGFYSAPPSEIKALDLKISMKKKMFFDLMSIYVNSANNYVSSERKRVENERK